MDMNTQICGLGGEGRKVHTMPWFGKTPSFFFMLRGAVVGGGLRAFYGANPLVFYNVFGDRITLKRGC